MIDKRRIAILEKCGDQDIQDLLTERRQLVVIAEIVELLLRVNPLMPGSHRLAEVIENWKESANETK